ncbi:MAG: hypothetical protein RMM53_03770 [Bacteroidia bacterium]|nr:hypothetical protein [Bacteroidia bacterium]MDW8333314.1 hypothetical protein [Bacteroidia bacterium]
MTKAKNIVGATLATWLLTVVANAQTCTPNPNACTPDPQLGVCSSADNLNVGYVGFNFEHTMRLLAAKSVVAPPNQFGINTVYIRRIQLLRAENLPAGVRMRVFSSNPADHPAGFHEPNAQGQFPANTNITRLPAAQDNHPVVGLYPCVVFYGLPQQVTQIGDSVNLVFNIFVNFSGDSGPGIDPNQFQPGFNPQTFKYPIVIRELAQVVTQGSLQVCTGTVVPLTATLLDNVGSPALALEPLIKWQNMNTGQIVGYGSSVSALVNETTTFRASVTDELGNTYFGETVVQVTPGLQITDVYASPACPSSGQPSLAYVTVSGGTGNYFYYWSTIEGGTINDSQSPTQVGLDPGTYEVYVQDDSGSDCGWSNAQVIIPQPIALSLAGPVQHPQQPDCVGGFRVQATGGGSPAGTTYRYFLNGGSPNTTGIFGNLTAGTYNVTAYAVENGVQSQCPATLQVTLNPCPSANPPVFIIQVQRRPFTAGTNNGRIRARAAGGTTPYRWQLFQADGVTPVGPPQNNVNPVVFDNLTVAPTGTSYVVRVTDAAGQTAEVTVRLN